MSDRSENTLLDRYLSLVEVARVLASTLDLDRLLYQIVLAAASLTDSSAASIILYDHNKNQLFFQSSTNMDSKVMRGLEVPIDNSIAGEIVQNRKPIIVLNADKNPRHFNGVGKSTDFKTESLVGVPMITNEKVVGVLEVINKKNGQFSDEDAGVLMALGSQAAVAIENTRLFQQSDLISEMVHELRTPLASIQTAAHLISKLEISDEQRRTMAETIQKEANRLSDLTTSFLEMARLESGRTQFRKETVNLEALLNEAADLMRVRIEEEGLQLKMEITPPLPEVEGDWDKLKQVLINLMSNAIKYNRPNGVITLGGSKYKDRVSFYVRDTGRGIKPEHVEQLFEKFYRIPGTENIVGTGLGLIISKKIVEGHGGTIEVNSELNLGTTFTVKLPLVN
ncbi:MAG: GAF domain-containing protein [Aliifodinibius sp.]|nr:GAF domain-containing protein [Fodinibius sp.]